MDTVLIERTESGKRAYKSLLVEPTKLSVLNNQLSLDILKELSRKPSCALDIARSLKEDEQRVYYFLKKLEASGLVKISRMERRHGMTAKIYELLAPVFSTKLHDDGGNEIEDNTAVEDAAVMEFLSPFIKDGKLNAIIVIGDPYSHGRFDKSAHEGPYFFDFGVLLGRFINSPEFPHYKLDTEVDEEDLKKNLILVGNIKSNVVIDRINGKLPIYYDTENDFWICSKITGNRYNDPRIGLVMKFTNPYNEKSKILMMGGIGSRGTRSSVIAFTDYFDAISKDMNNGNLFKIVKGYAGSGDRVIDAVEILE